MLTTVITFLTNRFGAAILPKLAAVLFGILGGLLLWFYFSNSHLLSENKELGTKVTTLTTQRDQAQADLNKYKDEVARNAAIDAAVIPAQNAVQIQKVEVIHEVINYRDLPAAVHSNLSAQWVCTHDHAAAFVPAVDLVGGLKANEQTPAQAICTSTGVTDSDALEVVTDNYAEYNALQLKYNTLWAKCSGYDPRHR